MTFHGDYLATLEPQANINVTGRIFFSLCEISPIFCKENVWMVFVYLCEPLSNTQI